MGINVGGTPISSVFVGSTPVKSVSIGSNVVWSSGPTPRSVTISTDSVGWFPTAPTHPIVAGVNSSAELSFATPVKANKAMRDWDNNIVYPAGSVIPAGVWLYVPDTHIIVKVTFVEYLASYPLARASVGLAGPHDWEDYSQSEFSGVIANIQSMGMERVRISALWNEIERTKGVYWWDQIDMLVNTAINAGIEPLVVLLGVPDWAKPDFETAVKGFRSEWEAFCSAVASRYAGVVGFYEVWNEPNLDRFWSNGSSATFLDIFGRAVTSIKMANPNAFVITGGLAPSGGGDGDEEPLAFITALYNAGVAQLADGIGWHPYSFPELPSGTSEWNTFLKMDNLKDLMVARGHSAKIWVTEIGAPTGGDVGVGEVLQAEIIREGIMLTSEDAMMGPMFVYTHKDLHMGEADMESWFGVYQSTGAPKVAVTVITNEITNRNG